MAFGDKAGRLLDVVSVCEWSYRLQKDRSEDGSDPFTPERIRMTRGLWARPFEELEKLFLLLGESDEVQRFSVARERRRMLESAIPAP
jgi:hypothetical protein